MNGLYNQDIYDQISRDVRERLIREAAEARRTRKAGLWFRLFGKKASDRRKIALDAAETKEKSLRVKPVRPKKVIRLVK